MIVGLVELIEALERSTKMKRAPAGARSKGLRIGAFVPGVGGMRVEMPGGAHFVWISEGNLEQEVTFNVKPIPGLLKVLRSHVGHHDQVEIDTSHEMITFACGGTKFSMAKNP
jgi:hypothetical protein